jgi:hypothetical protein
MHPCFNLEFEFRNTVSMLTLRAQKLELAESAVVKQYLTQDAEDFS